LKTREKKPKKKTPARKAVPKKKVVRKPGGRSVKKERVGVHRKGETSGVNGEGLYESLFKNNHAVMLLMDPDSGNIVDANPAA
jgi:hypothetical protein